MKLSKMIFEHLFGFGPVSNSFLLMNIYFLTSHFRNDATIQIARTCFLSKVSKLERLCSMLRTFKRLEFLDR